MICVLEFSTTDSVVMVEPKWRGPVTGETDWSSVANLTFNGRSHPEKVQKLRNEDASKPNAFGPSSGAKSMSVIKGVPVLVERSRPGRRGEEGMLIQSGHTGERFSATATRWSEKAKKRWGGIPEANSASIETSEMITVSSGSGSVVTYATHAVGYGDDVTWMYPPINTPQYDKEVSDVRSKFNKFGVPGFIPTFLVPVTDNLLTDSLTPMYDLLVKIINSSVDGDVLSNNLAALKDSEDTYEKALYYGIYLPMAALSPFLPNGLTTGYLVVASNYGILEQRGARELQKFAPVAQRAAFNDLNKKKSLNGFHAFHAAISSMKLACRPIGVAMDSANPGDSFRLALK